jgi:hypothetical protein
MRCPRCLDHGEPMVNGCAICGKKRTKPGRYRRAPKEERTLDGVTFHSKKEMRRYAELQVLERAGKITDLQRQVRFRIEVNGVLICTYVADHVYTTILDGVETGQVVEDSKGHRTQLYKLKAKLMLAVHGIEILET